MKKSLHPLNIHKSGYDFELLTQAYPDLSPFIIENQSGAPTINYSNQDAVKHLNKALLKAHYQIDFWDIPDQYLIPPIPGRADYIHLIAELLGKENKGKIPKGENISVLDVGVGANCIYPLLGNRIYGWQFVGVDIEPEAIDNAQNIISKNKGLSEHISIRLQPDKKFFFKNIVKKDEYFDLSLCNPPYHNSAEAAAKANQRKNKNLGIAPDKGIWRNFGGQNQELWYEGGELAFIKDMIRESKAFGQQFFWFSSIISKKEHILPIEKFLKKMEVSTHVLLKMNPGQKFSRIVCWSFLDDKQRRNWTNYRLS